MRPLPALLAFICTTATFIQQPVPWQTPAATSQKTASKAPRVAIIPWAINGGTEGAVETIQKAIVKIFENQGYETFRQAESNAVWKRDMGMTIPDTNIGEHDTFADLPKAKDALAFGKLMKADYVCVGRVKLHTKSVWVGLGPKTKAEAMVDCMLIDVAKEEIILDAKKVESDSNKRESSLETAGALFISLGITAFSGGPKTPHQERAGVQAVALAFDPWLKTLSSANKKIGSR